MKKFPIILFIVASLLAFSCQQKMEINPSYRIVVDRSSFSDTTQIAAAEKRVDWSGDDYAKMNVVTENYAARELHNYLCKIVRQTATVQTFKIIPMQVEWPEQAIVLADLSHAAVEPRIAVLIKEKKLTEKVTQRESFAIVPQGEKLFIIGHDRVGVLDGVYSLLESLGVRWYEPGEKGEIIPQNEPLLLPAEMRIERPAFITRGFWAWEDRGNRDFYIWMARNRLNFWTIAEPDRPFLRKLGIQLTVGGHLHFDRFLNPDDEYPFNHPRFNGDENKPADPYDATSAEFRGDVNRDGKLTYFEAHPEWYGLVDSVRRTFKGDFGTNICTSNKDAVHELCRKLVNELATGEWRDASTLNFWPIDGGDWCECDQCKLLGTPTDRLLLLIHQVRTAIARAMDAGTIKRNIKVIFPIYNETLSPPTRPLPQNFDYENCIGTFFPIRRCYVHTLDDPSCTEFNTPIWDDFLGWTRKSPHYYKGQFFIGEYYNVSAIKSLPVLYSRIMAHDIPLYYRYGVRHCHYMHVYTGLMGMKRINNYLFAKLLWRPQTEVTSLLHEYYRNFYGLAAGKMAHLYDRLEFAMSSVKQWKHTKSLIGRINADKDTLFNLKHLQLHEFHPPQNDGVDLEESVNALQECRRIMDEVGAEDWSPVMKDRLADDDRNLRYAENTVNFYYYFVQAIQAKKAGDLKQAKKFYQKSVPYARGLKAETKIVQTASSHANAADGLAATRVEKKFRQIGQELGLEFK